MGFCATTWGGNDKRGEAVRGEMVDGCLHCLGVSFMALTFGGFWGVPIILAWETWISGHPILSVCVIFIGLSVHFGVLGLGIIGSRCHPVMSLELLHLPRWQQIALVPVTPSWLRYMFGDTRFRKSAEDRAAQLRQYA